jgi:ABC-type Fe3+ transport system permease subunit
MGVVRALTPRMAGTNFRERSIACLGALIGIGITGLISGWAVGDLAHLPLLVAPLGAAALLVFVDCMKELPATLLLRPFNFETLATHVYSFASIEQLEQASLGALTIVLVGLVPVLLLHEAIAGGRPGESKR